MLTVLVKQSVPLKDIDKVSSYHQKLTYGEMASMLKLQYAVAQRMGVAMLDPKHLFGEGVEANMVETAFNAIDSETLSEWQTCKSFNSLAAGLNVVLVLFNRSEDKEVPGWDCLDATTFSGALLETIVAKVGYLQAHFGEVVTPKLGEFTLAEVYKLLGIENP